MSKYLLSIDQSTSATKAILFDDKAQICDQVAIEHKQFYPQAGWVEHDPMEIYRNTVSALKKLVEKNNQYGNDIISISITNQRETVVVWDKSTGLPVYNAIVWQCRRGAAICYSLIEKGYQQKIQTKTGLIIDPYFSASGVQWIIENVKEVQALIQQNKLAVGTIDSWLLFKLTNGAVHATDFTNASRTMLFNIVDKKWDDEILSLFKVPPSAMPKVLGCDSVFGKTNVENLFKNEIPIVGIMGDSHAALFGQNCFESGLAKATFGTGSSVMMNIGEDFRMSPQGLVTSIGYTLHGKTFYVFEGNIHCTGATIKWLIDDLELINSSVESEQIATSVADNNGVYFVPAFAGLGAPYWNNEVNAMICGMNRGAKKAHIVRAALEAIAYQIKDLIDAMTQNSGIILKELRVDGGPTKNKFLMQFQSDMLQAQINRAEISEASALGVALMAGLRLGIWKNEDELKSLRKNEMIIAPNMSDTDRKKLYEGWKLAIRKTIAN